MSSLNSRYDEVTEGVSDWITKYDVYLFFFWKAWWPHGQRAPSPDRAVRVVLCSWARHFTLTVPLSTQVYKWVLANLMLGVTLRWTSIPSRGEKKYS